MCARRRAPPPQAERTARRERRMSAKQRASGWGRREECRRARDGGRVEKAIDAEVATNGSGRHELEECKRKGRVGKGDVRDQA